MKKTRVIPVLLLRSQGLVKTFKFKDPKYIGDPINAVRIFNEKEVDELIFLDIDATKNSCEPNFELLTDIAGEAFMPMAYGGGITSLDQIRRIFALGFEKVVLNSVTYKNSKLIEDAASIFGSQSIVASLDVKKNLFGKYELYSSAGSTKESVNLFEHLNILTKSGVGEIFINSIDRDGAQQGYDIHLLRSISEFVDLPVVACGGAGNLDHLIQAVTDGGVSAVAAGSLFIFKGPHRAVLINYPDYSTLEKLLP